MEERIGGAFAATEQLTGSDEEQTFEVESLEFLRCAIVDGDQSAWAAFQQRLEKTILAWLNEHPGREAACRWQCEKDLVAQAFERFWQATSQTQAVFESPVGMLAYLRASLHGAILDTLRISLQPKALSLPGSDKAGQPQMEDQSANLQAWEVFQSMLPDARERRLAYLLYHCGLSPREIVRFCPQEWNDLQEISHLRHVILERLLRKLVRLH